MRRRADRAIGRGSAASEVRQEAAERGVVLAQVLIMTLVLGYIAAMILRMVLQPTMVAANATKTSVDTKKAEAAINRVQAAWIEGGVCTGNARLGVSCPACTQNSKSECTGTLPAGVLVKVKVSAPDANGARTLSATP